MPSHSCASSLPHFSAHKMHQRTFAHNRKMVDNFIGKTLLGGGHVSWECSRVSSPGSEKKPQSLRERKKNKQKNNNRQSGHFHSSESLTLLWGNRVHWFRWGKMAAAHSGISQEEKPKKKKKKLPVHTATTRGRALLSVQSHSLFLLCWRLLWVRITNHLRM